MNDVSKYFAHKRLEIVLFVILALLLYVRGVPLSSSLIILVVAGGILASYEYAFQLRIFAMIKRFGLEALLFIILSILAIFWVPDIESLGVVLLAYFLFVVTLNSKIVQSGLVRGIADVRRDRASSVLLAIILALLIIWNFKIDSTVFIATFVAFLLYRWESRILAACALVSLIACPFLLMLGESAFAEQMAVYAYYFLVMTVALQIIEFKREPQVPEITRKGDPFVRMTMGSVIDLRPAHKRS